MTANLAPLTPDDLRRIRIEGGLSVPEASKAVGVSRTTWWRWEEQGVEVPEKLTKVIRGLAEPDGVPKPELDDAIVQVPVYAPRYGGEGIDGFLDENISCHIGLDRDYIRKMLHSDPDYIAAVTINGDSMEPTARAGEIAVIALAKPGASAGDGVHIVRLDGNLMCKRLAKLPGRKVMVTSDNPAVGSPYTVDLQAPDNDFVVLGRVVSVVRHI